VRYGDYWYYVCLRARYCSLKYTMKDTFDMPLDMATSIMPNEIMADHALNAPEAAILKICPSLLAM
jgi:hypothetical protein